MANRVVNLAAVCLLDGEAYRTREYVLQALTQACESTQRDLVVLPYTPFLTFDKGKEGESLLPFAALARKYRSYIAVAMNEQVEEKTFATSVFFDREGRIAFRYRKTHAFADDDRLALGDELRVFNADFGVIGATIGSDFYFPEVYETLRMKGAELLVWHTYPERFRDYSGYEPLLTARAFDSHAHLLVAMYADPRTYITNRYTMGMQGAAWGRSMILNRVGIPIADTGHADGVAAATVDLDKRKEDPYDPWVQSENKFFVNCLGDRTAFHPVAEPWQPPTLPPYRKRRARIAVIYLWDHHMWRTGERPTQMLKLLEKAAEITPDLILISENHAKIDDEVGRQTCAAIADYARKIAAYIVVGGLRNGGSESIVYVWNRDGEIIFTQPIYWTKGFPEINVFDTDFARLGTHECGDLYTPMIDRVLTLKGAEIILDPSQMWGADGRTNETLLRARAVDNGVWVACAHWNSSDPGLRSVIIDPYGQVMASSVFQQEGLIHVDIDFDDQRVFYAGRKPEQPTRGTEGISSYYSEDIPEQKRGWRPMMLSHRRPELYDIIPTENAITRRYRPEKGPG
ncbi:MAG: carbon-nitrogen hydrolase family protein [Candidatus Zipacnadales bacterium]